jgi:hypothetical protein
MATMSLGPSTPLQIMRKVFFQVYTFFASKVARELARPEGVKYALSLEP